MADAKIRLCVEHDLAAGNSVPLDRDQANYLFNVMMCIRDRMGAARICPVQTDFTNSDRVRQDKLQAHAMEAAEQCGGTYVPQVAGIEKLKAVLEAWPEDRHLMFCDEALAGPSSGLAQAQPGKWAILIGPEGGFSEAEREVLSRMEQSLSVSLGPRILRADTAAVAALTLWQASLGDWA